MINCVKRLFRSSRSTQREHRILLNGVDGFTTYLKNGGNNVGVSGWNHKHYSYKVGDNVVLIQRDKGYLYKINKIWRPGDPQDQYFIDCEFIGGKT